MRRVVSVASIVVVVGSAVVIATAHPASAVASIPRAGDAAAAFWSPPVDGEVVHPFRPALNPYGAGGHAGVDYPAAAGAHVRAAGDGVVSFTGQVAGAVFVVVTHGHDLRTTYAPMETVHVRRGDEVARGAFLGLASGAGLHPGTQGTLHFGLRRGDTPLDPLRLFREPDLTEIVRLVPADDFGAITLASVQGERSRLTRWVRGAVSLAGDRLLDGSAAPPLAVSQALLGSYRVAQGVHEWVTRGECTSRTEARRREIDTGRPLVVVAGLNSAWDQGEAPPLGLPVRDLGYDASEVTVFSYATDGGAYDHADTHVGPEVAAARLAAQLAARARSRPDGPIDLIGHSQGGVVVEAFLKLHYAGHEDEFPPIGSVVTLAAPHRGAPLAGAARRVASLPPARGAFRAASGVSGTLPAPGSGSAAALDPGSDFIRALRRTPLPEGVRMTTIAGVDDLIVPAPRTRVDGAENVVVNPRGWNDHSGLLTDPDSVAATGLALVGAPPPCAGLAQSVRGRYQPHVVEFLTP